MYMRGINDFIFFQVDSSVNKVEVESTIVWWRHHIDTADHWTTWLPVAMPLQMAVHNTSIFIVL